MTTETENGSSEQVPSTRGKPGVFPRLPLSKVIELPETIYKLGQGEQVRKRTVFDDMKKSPDSGPSRSLIAAANSGYGLIQGSSKTEYLSITSDGTKIATSKNEPERFRAIYDVLFKNDIFSAFIDRFNDRALPIDEIAIDYLKGNHQLSEKDAKSAWDIFKENIQEYGLIQTLSGKQILVSREASLEAVGGNVQSDEDKKGDGGSEGYDTGNNPYEEKIDIGKANNQRSNQQDLVPQIVFNIQVVLPENASAQDYENIFKSIGTHLLKRTNV